MGRAELLPRKKAILALSLDVEEEGLFSASYACNNPSVTNTRELWRLTPLLERGLHPTLFCSHSVLSDLPSQRILGKLCADYNLEIGAHLHHWNTPPLSCKANTASDTAEIRKSVPTSPEPLPLLAAKMRNLFSAGKTFLGESLTSFRMGRWDLHAKHWPLLAENGVRCDASVRPLHLGNNANLGPDHFDAPADPYWVNLPGHKICEVPLTVTPLTPFIAHALKGIDGTWGKTLRTSLKNWGALALLPVQHPLWLLKLTSRLHLARGGRVLSLTWHSSEMLPGGAPHIPNEAAVRNLLGKITAYVDWLAEEYDLESLTMRQILPVQDTQKLAARRDSGADWTAPSGEHIMERSLSAF